MIKESKINNVTEHNYKLIRKLAETIHSIEAEETKEVRYVPDVIRLKKWDNPTEICLVYLREKIAQSQGLVDAID